MNYLIYPFKVMNITQSYTGSYTHERHAKGNLKDYPIDDACGSGNDSYFYCPCDEMVVKKVYGVGIKASNTVWLESTSEVITPTFKDYVTIMVVHPNDKDLKNVYVGKKYKRGDKLFPKGSDGNVTGPHFHLTLGRGKFTNGGWTKNNLGLWIMKTTKENIKPEHGFFVDGTFTTVKNKKNLEFIDLYEKEEVKNNVYYTTANLNVRYGAGSNYAFVNTLVKNTKVSVLAIENGWAKLGDGEYVSLNFLTQTKPVKFYESKYTTAELLNVRSKPNGQILYKIPKNTIVSVMNIKNNWVEIYPNRYIYADYLN